MNCKIIPVKDVASKKVSEITGLKFIIVDAKEDSKTFYEHYGFIQFAEKELCYFLPVETVRMAING